MWDVRGREEKISCSYRHYAILEAVMRRASRDDVNFVAEMRRMQSIGQFSREPDFKIAIAKNLGRTLGGLRERKCCR